MNMKIVGIAAALAAAGFSSQTLAATVVEWDLLGQSGSQASVAASFDAANITGANLSRGAGLSGNAGANSLNAAGWNNQATDFFSFGFTADAGYSVDLEELYLGSRSSNSGPGSIGLFSSLDGFATALVTFNQAPGSNFVNSIVDLSGLPDITGSIEFRLMQIGSAAANGGATASNGTFRVTAYFENGAFNRNLGLTGTVTAPVPVPAALWLLAPALGFVARRRAA